MCGVPIYSRSAAENWRFVQLHMHNAKEIHAYAKRRWRKAKSAPQYTFWLGIMMLCERVIYSPMYYPDAPRFPRSPRP